MLSHPFRTLFAKLSRPARSARRRPPVRQQLRIELLEDRLTPSVDMWTGANYQSDTFWSDAQNWSLGHSPGASDTAWFTNNSSVKASTVTVDTPASIGALDVDANWGGSITSSSPLTFGGTSTWDSGTINTPLGGRLTNNGTLTLNDTGGITLGGGGTFVNNGTIIQMGKGDLVMVRSGNQATTLLNAAGAVYDFQSDCRITDGNWVYGYQGGLVTNNGTIEKTGGTGTSSLGPVGVSNLGGTLDAETGTLQIASSNNGESVGGTYNAAGGAVLDLTGGWYFNETGTFTGTGAGTILINGGQVNIYGASATFNIASTVSLQWPGTYLTIPVGENLTYNGVLNLTGSNGEQIQGGGTFNLKGIVNQTGSGALNLQGDSTTNTATTLNVAAGAVYDFQADSGIGSFGYGGGVITNAGTIKKTGGSGTSAIYTPVVNSGGTFDAETGTLQLNDSGSDSNGIFNAAAGATLQLAVNQYAEPAFTETGTFTATGAGAVSLNGGAFAASGSAVTLSSPTGTFQWVGKVTVPVNDTLNFTGSMNLTDSSNETLDGGGTFINKGTITQSGNGNLVIATGPNSAITTLDNAAGASYAFVADSGILNASWYPTGLLINAGTISKTAGVATSPITAGFDNIGGTLTVQTGTLQLQPIDGASTGGKLNVSAGAVLDLTGGTTVDYSGTYTGTGTGHVLLAGGALQATGGSGGAIFSLPAGMFQWDGGTIDTNLTKVKVSNLTLSGVNVTENLKGGGTLYLSGSNKDLSSGNTLSIASGTELNNQTGSTLDLQADANLSGGGAVTNAGTLKKSKGTSNSTISTFLDNTGKIQVYSGSLSLTGTVNQLSNNTLMAGSWQVYSTATVPATLTIASGNFTTIGQVASITLSGPKASFTNLAGVTTNQGSLSLLGCTLTVNGGFTQTSTGTLTIQVTYSTGGSQVGQILTGSGGSVNLAGKLAVTVKGSPPAGKSFTLLDDGNAASTISGSFATVVLPAGYQLSYNGGDGNDLVMHN
jgi:hypothetical protein